MEILSGSTAETEKIGLEIGKSLKGGETIALTGELGAGKTTLVKSIAKGLGIEKNILSPTFTIVREYEGRLKLYHFDFYRLNSEDELYEIGFSEYINDKDAVTIIEWADMFPGVLPTDCMNIRIEYTGEDSRRFITDF